MNLWPLFIHTYPYRLELTRNFLLLFLSLLSVQYHHNEVRGLSHGDDLATAPLPGGGTLNDTWQIEQLHLRFVDSQHSGDASECGELVVGGETLGLSQVREDRRLTDTRETDHGNTGVTVLLHIETLSLASCSSLFLTFNNH